MDLTPDSAARLPGPLEGPAVWTADELVGRPEWNHRLEPAEARELLALLDRLDGDGTVRGQPIEQAAADDLPLPVLSERLETIARQLEQGAGAVGAAGVVEDLSDAIGDGWVFRHATRTSRGD